MGKGKDLWNDKPHKKCHKDVEARWTKKRQETHYGYKQHVKADVKSKLIDTYVVTDKSKIRCRVEHIFGFEEGSMKGLVVRSIGLMRAKANVALTSLVYNMFRFIQIVRYKPEWVKI